MDELEPSELIQRHQSGVWRYLRALGCDESTADDLTQETFLRVLRREQFVQHSDGATAEYLRRTAYNLVVSNHRKQGRMQVTPSAEMLDEAWLRWAGKDLTGDEAIDALRTCLGELTERAQSALRMRFVENTPRVKIGENLGITDHGARNLMQRAKAQLRECVSERLKQISAESANRNLP
ncbi:MAG: sigma-70 family RNA polymerase sigma factor [Planctomycetota bacterium]